MVENTCLTGKNLKTKSIWRTGGLQCASYGLGHQRNCSSAESKLHHFSRLCTRASAEIIFLSKDMITGLKRVFLMLSLSAVKPGPAQILIFVKVFFGRVTPIKC